MGQILGRSMGRRNTGSRGGVIRISMDTCVASVLGAAIADNSTTANETVN